LSATLTGNGITNSDQYNLKWHTSDSDIVQVTGISSEGTVSGQSIYITAMKPGEALITCSHEKAASDLQFYVVVPGTGEKLVTLNKTYLTLTRGSSGTQLKATIDNAESSSNYYDLIWSAEQVNEIFPNMVYKPLAGEDNPDPIWSVKHWEFTPYLVKTVQLQNERIIRLENKIAELENQFIS
jgi:hypothetical protein